MNSRQQRVCMKSIDGRWGSWVFLDSIKVVQNKVCAQIHRRSVGWSSLSLPHCFRGGRELLTLNCSRRFPSQVLMSFSRHMYNTCIRRSSSSFDWKNARHFTDRRFDPITEFLHLLNCLKNWTFQYFSVEYKSHTFKNNSNHLFSSKKTFSSDSKFLYCSFQYFFTLHFFVSNWIVTLRWSINRSSHATESKNLSSLWMQGSLLNFANSLQASLFSRALER